MEHEAGNGEKRESGQDFRHPFIVAGEAAEARQPGGTALDHPTAGQQHEATFGLRQRDHRVTGRALIHTC